MIEHGRGRTVVLGPHRQAFEPGPHVGLGRRHADPVLQTAVDLGGVHAVREQQQSGNAVSRQALAAKGLLGPADHGHIHAEGR